MGTDVVVFWSTWRKGACGIQWLLPCERKFWEKSYKISSNSREKEREKGEGGGGGFFFFKWKNIILNKKLLVIN